MPPNRRRSASPDVEHLADLGDAPPAGRLRKAPTSDPVLGVAGSPAPTPENAPPAEEQETSSRGPRRTAAAEKAGKSKVGFYQHPENTARARAAFMWTRMHEGHRSFSDFLDAAVMREVERLEQQYNHGRSWEPLEPGEIPTGKPLE